MHEHCPCGWCIPTMISAVRANVENLTDADFLTGTAVALRCPRCGKSFICEEKKTAKKEFPFAHDHRFS